MNKPSRQARDLDPRMVEKHGDTTQAAIAWQQREDLRGAGTPRK
jgi:hypothetical protein